MSTTATPPRRPSDAPLERAGEIMNIREPEPPQQQSLVETSATALAARETAMIQSMYVLGLKCPRKWSAVEQELLEFCQQPGFAEEARWSRPVGKKKDEKTGKWVDEIGEGFSIRFAEAAAMSLRNVYISSDVTAESSEYRILRSILMDVERNVVWVSPDVVEKTMERSRLFEGQESISVRKNSQGQNVYTVKADDAMVRNKMNSALARTNRGNILKMLPAYIKDACEAQIAKTLAGQSPEAALERLVRAFDKLKVTQGHLQEYLGHSLSAITDEELKHLRGVYTIIKEEEDTWQHVLELRKTDLSAKAQDAAAQKHSGTTTPKQTDTKPAPPTEQQKPAETASGETQTKPPAEGEPAKPEGPKGLGFNDFTKEEWNRLTSGLKELGFKSRAQQEDKLNRFVEPKDVFFEWLEQALREKEGLK